MSNTKFHMTVLFIILGAFIINVSSDELKIQNNATLSESGESDAVSLLRTANGYIPGNGSKSLNISGTSEELIDKVGLISSLSPTNAKDIVPTPTLNTNIVIVTATKINSSKYVNADTLSMPEHETNHTLVFPMPTPQLISNSTENKEYDEKLKPSLAEDSTSISLESSREVEVTTPEYGVQNSLAKYSTIELEQLKPTSESSSGFGSVAGNQSSSEATLDDNYLSAVFATSSYEKSEINKTNSNISSMPPFPAEFWRPNPFDNYQNHEQVNSSFKQDSTTELSMDDHDENYNTELSWNEMIAPIINSSRLEDKIGNGVNTISEDLPSPSPLLSVLNEQEQAGLEDEYAEAFMTKEMASHGQNRRRRPGPGTKRKVRMRVRKLNNSTSNQITEQPQYLRATEPERWSDYDIDIKKVNSSRTRRFRSTTTTEAPQDIYTAIPIFNTQETPGLAKRLNEMIMRNTPNSLLKVETDLLPERQIEKPGNAYVDSISTYHVPPRVLTTTSKPNIHKGADGPSISSNSSQGNNEWLHSSTLKHHDYPHTDGQFLLSRHKWEKNYMNLQQNSFYGASPEDLDGSNKNIEQSLVALNRPETKDRNLLTSLKSGPIPTEEQSIIIINEDSGEHQNFQQDNPDIGLRESIPKFIYSNQSQTNQENIIRNLPPSQSGPPSASPDSKPSYNYVDNQGPKEFISIHALQTTDRHSSGLAPDLQQNPTIEVIPIDLNGGSGAFNPYNSENNGLWGNNIGETFLSQNEKHATSHYDRTRHKVTELPDGYLSTEITNDPNIMLSPHAEVIDYPLEIPRKKTKHSNKQHQHQFDKQRGLKQPAPIPIKPFESHEFLGFGYNKHLDPESLNNDMIPGVRKKATENFHGTKSYSNPKNQDGLPQGNDANYQIKQNQFSHSPRIPDHFFDELEKIGSQFPSNPRPVTENPGYINPNNKKNRLHEPSNVPFAPFPNQLQNPNGYPPNIREDIRKDSEYFSNTNPDPHAYSPGGVQNSPGFTPDRGPLLDGPFQSHQTPHHMQRKHRPQSQPEYSQVSDSKVLVSPKITLPMPGLVNIPTPPPESHALNEVYSHRHYPPHTHSISSKPDYEPANPPLQKGHPLEYHFDPFIQNAGDFKGEKIQQQSRGKSSQGKPGKGNSVRETLNQYKDTNSYQVHPSRKQNSNFQSVPEFSNPPKKKPKKKQKSYFPNLFRSNKPPPKPIPQPEADENISYYYSKESSPELSHNPQYYYPSEGSPPNPNTKPFDHINTNTPSFGHVTSQENSLKGYSRFPGPQQENSEMFSNNAYVLMFPKMVPETAMMPKRPHINGKKIPVISASDPIRGEMEAPGFYPIRASPREQMLQVLASNHYNIEMEKYMEKKRKPPTPIYTPYGMLVPMGSDIPSMQSQGSSNNQVRTNFHKTGPLENVNREFSIFGENKENIGPALELLAEKLANKLSEYDQDINHSPQYSEADGYEYYNRDTSYSNHNPMRTKPRQKSNRMDRSKGEIKIPKHFQLRKNSKSSPGDGEIKKALKTLIKDRLYEMLAEANVAQDSNKQENVNKKKPYKYQDREAAFLPMNMIVESSNTQPIIQEHFTPPFGTANIHQTTPVPTESTGGILQSIKQFFFGKGKKITPNTEHKPHGVWMKGPPPMNPYLNNTGKFPNAFLPGKSGIGTNSLIKKQGIPAELTQPSSNNDDEIKDENSDPNTNDIEIKPKLSSKEQSVNKIDMQRILQILYKAANKSGSVKKNQTNELADGESSETLKSSEESRELTMSSNIPNPTTLSSESRLPSLRNNLKKRKNDLISREHDASFETKSAFSSYNSNSNNKQLNSFTNLRKLRSKSSAVSEPVIEYDNLYKSSNDSSLYTNEM